VNSLTLFHQQSEGNEYVTMIKRGGE